MKSIVTILVVLIILVALIALVLYIVNTQKKEGYRPTNTVPKDQKAVVRTPQNPAVKDLGDEQGSTASGPKADDKMAPAPKTRMAAPIFAERIVIKTDTIPNLFTLRKDYQKQYGVSKAQFDQMVVDYKEQGKMPKTHIPKTLTFDIQQHIDADKATSQSIVNMSRSAQPIDVAAVHKLAYRLK